MPLTPEEREEILGLMGEAFKPLVAELEDRTNKTVSGAVKRLLSESIDPIKQTVNTFGSELTGVKETLGSTVKSSMDNLLAELAEQVVSEDQGGQGSPAPQNQDVQALIAQALKEYESKSAAERKKLESRVRQAEEAQAAAQQEAVRIAEQNRIASMKDNVLKQLSGKVRPGTEHRLLTLMEQEGLLKEDKEANAYRLPSKDKYGDDILVDVGELLPTILEKQYPEYLPPRAGTGTGAAPVGSSVANQGAGGNKYIQEGTKAQDLLAIAGDPAKWDEALKELEQAVS